MRKANPKWYTTVSALSIFLFCMGLIVIRWINIFNPDIVVVNKEINSHITNFALSVLLCILMCFSLLSAGMKYKSNLIVGACIISLNFVYEIFLPILNTTDIVDAIYGTIGVCISLIYLYFISKYGFGEAA